MQSQSSAKVHFFFEGVSFDLRNRKKLRRVIESIFRKEKKKLKSINYIFTTDKIIYRINKDYLGHDFFTDIITFLLSEIRKPIEAEIYISIDRIRENAVDHGTTYKNELRRVMIHGALHLCGYDDKKLMEKKEMTGQENYYLLKYFN